jgi:hypothetical protein
VPIMPVPYAQVKPAAEYSTTTGKTTLVAQSRDACGTPHILFDPATELVIAPPMAQTLATHFL